MTDDQLFIAKIKTIGTIVRKGSESLPYGNKSRGKFIPPTADSRGIFVPSFGALEKEEVDYYVEKAQDDEKHRKKEVTPMKENIGKLTTLARLQPEGKRSKIIKETLTESRR